MRERAGVNDFIGERLRDDAQAERLNLARPLRALIPPVN
jgi:hypothetical protein